MNWTKELPTKPGFYLSRSCDFKKFSYPQVHNIEIRKGKLCLFFNGNFSILDKIHNHEWLGPLPE